MDSDANVRELILYIADQCKDDPTFSDTKLNKILQFSDFTAFRELGVPITGAEYMKEKYGIILKRMKPIRETMAANKEIDIQWQPIINLSRKRVIARKRADMSRFSSKQREIVDKCIGELWGRNSNDVSSLSQKQVGYKVTEIGESVPYEAALLSSEGITEADIKRTEELIAEHGWNV
jgi:hypothetical protein